MQTLNYIALPTDKNITKTIIALELHGINTIVAKTSKDVKKIISKLIPKGSEVMTATSTTLDQLGISQDINESAKFDPIKAKLMKMDRNTQSLKMQKLGSAPDYVIGSVHAVTEDGKVVIASGSGSQLPAYAYGAPHVIWVVSTKKIVKDLDSAFDRIYNHILPLEDKRMKAVYGPNSGSNVNKLLIISNEINPNRITLIFVKEDLGF